MKETIQILLIDDDEEDFIITRDLFSDIEHIKYNLDWVSSYKEGLDAIARREHEVYLVDYRLGAENGLALMEEAIQSGCRDPMILLTGQGDHEIDVKATRVGATDYLIKGRIDAGLLERSVRYALERYRTLGALRDSEERYTRALQGAKDGVWDWNLHSNEMVFSPRWYDILGLTPGEILQTSEAWFELIHPEDLVQVKADVTGHFRSDEPHFETEHRMLDKNGRTIWVLCRGIAISDEFGIPSRMSGTLTDISERKQAEVALKESQHQLLQSQKMEGIGLLAGGIAHDFNNLLTSILGFSQLILDGCEDDPVFVRSSIESIIESAEKAARLTNQLLTFSRKKVFIPTVINPDITIEGMIKMFGHLIGEDVELITDLNSKGHSIKVDESQLEQVVLNLVVNARDAMPRGGKIMIETDNVELDEVYCTEHPEVEPGPHIMIAISDTGTGMDQDVLNKIFEPFFSTKEPGKGTGLGLSTVYGIVQESSGHIWVYSEIGSGTSFKIYFPWSDIPATTTKSSQVVIEIPSGTESILVVEDEPGVRASVTKSLRRTGYDVLEAESGKEALMIMDRHAQKVDLLLTDVVMPDMGGYELIKKLEESDRSTKVILMSGYTHHAVFEQGLLDSGIKFLQKPFTLNGLNQTVRETLDA